LLLLKQNGKSEGEASSRNLALLFFIRRFVLQRFEVVAAI
jgi:hypothetical protein